MRLPCRNDRKYPPPHHNPLPPRGEGVRRGLFTPLLSKSKKGGKIQNPDEKNKKYFLPLLI